MARISTYSQDASISADDLLVGSDAEDSNITKNYRIGDLKSSVCGYKEYVIAFSQSGTNNPVITEFQNNTGLTITWVRAAPGVYDGTPDTNFDITKTWVQVTGGTSENTTLHLKEINASKIRLINMALDGNPTPQDGLDNGFLELRIYN
jgi:hypothetical protein